MNTDTLLQHSIAIEKCLVRKNLRGMRDLSSAHSPGSCLRAAQILHAAAGTVIIGTGFPVADTFETDGPTGAIALYHCLNQMGCRALIACSEPLYSVLQKTTSCLALPRGPSPRHVHFCREKLSELQPHCLISIECPGKSRDGEFYNMRNQSITSVSADFDTFIRTADCPTIGIGDGGNEIGMGALCKEMHKLDITPSVTPCDELILADVSNWGTYGIIALLSLLREQDCLKNIQPFDILNDLNQHGSIDGLTLRNEPTEDGQPASEGQKLIDDMRKICGFI
ncbi:DUF4392 domain-containing protein [Kiritimatiellaeota bacterium B1221]|nr:DUF4392 domain-containing protein [Kiritimatiellaeota bacterium B1221]